MTEIIVIKNKEDNKLSTEEKVEGINLIAKELSIDQSHVDDFIWFDSKEKIVKPEIDSVLIRELCKYNNIIPIIKNPDPLTVSDFADVKGNAENVGVLVQFESNVNSVFISDIKLKKFKYYRLNKEENYEVFGLLISNDNRLPDQPLPWMFKAYEQLLFDNYKDNYIVNSLILPLDIIDKTEKNLSMFNGVVGGKVSSAVKKTKDKKKIVKKSVDKKLDKKADKNSDKQVVNKQEDTFEPEDEKILNFKEKTIFYLFNEMKDYHGFLSLLYDFQKYLDNLKLGPLESFRNYNAYLNNFNKKCFSGAIIPVVSMDSEESIKTTVIPPTLLKYIDNLPIQIIPGKYETSILMELSNIGLLTAYHSFLTSAATELNLEQIVQQNSLHYENFLKNKTLLIDNERDLAVKNAIAYKYFKKSYNSLSDKEKTIAENDFKRREINSIALRNNKCPHVEILSSLMENFTEQNDLSLLDKKYKQLEKYINPAERKVSKWDKIAREYITCTNCKYNMICPHERDQILLTLGHDVKMPIDNIRKFLMKYASEVPLHDGYYCKICSGLITENITLEGYDKFVAGEKVNLVNVEDSLREFINQSIVYIVVNHIAFKKPPTKKFLNDFISSLVSILYTPLHTQEKIINRTKTDTEDEKNDRMQLFTDIYIFAALIKIIKDNSNVLSLKKKENGEIKSETKSRGLVKEEKTSGKAPPLEKIFNQALSIITTTRNVLINKLSLDSGIIERSFYKAYKILETYMGKSKINEEKETKRAVINPIEKYIETYKSLSLPHKFPAQITNYKEYYIASFQLFKEYLENIPKIIYTTQSYIDPNNEKIFHKKVEYTKEFEVYNSKQNALLESETILINAYRNSIKRVFMKTPMTEQIGAVSRKDKLCLRYGMPYHYHSFKYAYSFPQKDVKEVLKLNPIKYEKYYVLDNLSKLPTAVQQNAVLVGNYCVKCEKIISTCGDILSDLNDYFDMDNFYNFYSYKCPEGFEHEFKNMVCKNCGFKPEFKNDKNKTYYKKYQTEFYKSIKTTTTITPLYLKKPDSVKKDKKEYYDLLCKGSDAYKQWKFNPVIISQFSETFNLVSDKLKIKKPSFVNFILNLGLSENQYYDKILSGEISPYKLMEDNDDLTICRIVNLENYIQDFIVTQTMLRNYDNIPNLPMEIKEFIKKNGAWLSKNAQNIGIFKGKYISEDYYGALNEMKKLYYTKSQYHKIALFLLDALLKMILRLYKESKVLHSFIGYFIEKMFENEKGLAKLKDKKAAEVSAKIGEVVVLDFNEKVGDTSLDGLVSEEDLEKSLYSEIDYDGEND